mmetsp:Transcript_30935/g.60991  ORF Transcript_30935/g.60991 Transcript_30935/m.60991 type:complete len:104 (-) Transcript_30935:573-884(-)
MVPFCSTAKTHGQRGSACLPAFLSTWTKKSCSRFYLTSRAAEHTPALSGRRKEKRGEEKRRKEKEKEERRCSSLAELAGKGISTKERNKERNGKRRLEETFEK